MKIWKVGVFFAAVGVLFNFIIPPFQNPDEPQHFGAVIIKARGEEQREVVEQEIIRFMDKHHWWKLLGMGRPKDLPNKISDIRFIMDYGSSSDFRDRLNRIFLYHFVMGNVVRVFFRDDIISAYYLCRLVSFLFIFGIYTFFYQVLIIDNRRGSHNYSLLDHQPGSKSGKDKYMIIFNLKFHNLGKYQRQD